jgi:hypothetical protein
MNKHIATNPYSDLKYIVISIHLSRLPNTYYLVTFNTTNANTIITKNLKNNKSTYAIPSYYKYLHPTANNVSAKLHTFILIIALVLLDKALLLVGLDDEVIEI